MRRGSIGPALLVGTVTALLLSVPAASQEPGGIGVEDVDGREAAAREVLVKFRRGIPPQDLAEIRALVDSDALQPVGRTGVLRLRSRSVTAAALLRFLATHRDVLYVQPNYLIHTFNEPADPSFPQLWGLRNTGQAVNGGLPGTAGADIHAAPAWDVSVGSTENVVAVVDSGIDYTHPDLAPNMWSAPSAFTVTIGGVPVTCAAGTHGFNARTMSCNPMDDNNHGSHTAGTIGAAGNNALGVSGVNWVTRLMAIKFIDANGSGTEADAINAIEFAIQVKQAFAATGGANVRVLSNSWGGRTFSQAMADQIAATNDADMLFVAAAGNDGISNDILPIYPASYDVPNIIAVAATTNTDARAWFSNYGASTVHLGAPGADILSTTVGNTYAYASGTSMATPHVSGAAALVLSTCTLNTAELKQTILGSVQQVPALAPFTITGGRLDVNNAIHSCIGPPAAPAGLTALAGNNAVTLNWSQAIGALSYNVKRGLAAGGPYAPLATDVQPNSYVDNTVVNGTTYYYVVSASNSLGDSADSNEASATPKTPSDLVVSVLTVPLSGGAGLTLQVSETTRNQGPGSANPTTTRFYLSSNSLLDTNDVLLNGVHDVPVLAPGAVSALSLALTIPTGVPAGLHYIIAKTDADGVEEESQESNNSTGRQLTIGPDLIVTSITAPASATPGGTIAVSDAVKNQGGGAAGASVTTFYLSVNTILDASDTLLSGSRAVSDLQPTGTSSGSASVIIPSTTATGTYYLIAKADGTDLVGEAWETNNTNLRSIQVGGDLVVSTMTVPAKAAAGAPISIADATTNQGSGAAAASVTRFYFSVNTILDATDTPLSDERAVPALAAGASSSGSTTVTIPASATTGTYYIIAKADAAESVAEAVESNNTALRSIQVGGDLTVSALNVVKGATPGTLLVTDTTTNQGASAVSGSATRFYLSTDVMLDGADTALSPSRSVPGLAGGSSHGGSTTVAVPAGTTPGTYYVIAKADADNAVTETQEANNSTARSVVLGPDLMVSSVSAGFSVAAGAAIAVSEVVLNQGVDGAGASTTRFFLSVNSVFDAGDVLLPGSRVVPALAAGASSSGSTSVTIPAGTAPGTYFLIVRADADNAVVEGQESNNTGLRFIQVTAP